LKTLVTKSPWIAALFAAGIIAYLLYLENTCLQVTRYEIRCHRLPRAFDGFRIVLISDLHGNTFGRGQCRLVDAIRDFEPDMIAIAGDFIDERQFTLAPALSLLQGIQGVAPICYVLGNHEAASGKFDTIQAQVEDFGVNVLRNRTVSITRGDDTIKAIGLDDPLAFDPALGRRKRQLQEELARVTYDKPEAFTVLAAHRPELIDIYAAYNVDLALCGHAHGGLIRPPGVGGLVAPGQGLLPRYTAGLYDVGNTTMVVGRGLGNSAAFQVRVFNRPELVLITLRSTE
jgi:predicted MPP superfamily phosphohydrolase